MDPELIALDLEKEPFGKSHDNSYTRHGLDEDDDYEEGKVVLVKGYKTHFVKNVFFIFLCLITGGLLPLLARWFKKMALVLRTSPVALNFADQVLIQRKDKSYDILPIKLMEKNGELVRYIEYRCNRYFYDNHAETFYKPKFNTSLPYSEICSTMSKGLSEESRSEHFMFYGPNLITVPVKSYVNLLLSEVLHPFYIFQVISMIIWCMDDYYVYAIAIFLTSAVAAITNVIQLKRSMEKLQKMATYITNVKLSTKSGHSSTVASTELVPGDIIEITDQFTLPCDLILLSGVAILNESVLTGESVPVIKTPIPENEVNTYDVSADNKYTLFAGTTVIQSRSTKPGQKVIAVVSNTGYQTAKGQLVRSILFPKPTKLDFFMDAFRFIGVMFGLAMIGFAFSIYQFIMLKATPMEIALRGLDIFTIVVPPALPLALTVGQYAAISRLQKQLIYCISPPRVNEAGKIEIMCFDKTGTLTEEGLDVLGVRAAHEHNQPATFVPTITEQVKNIPVQLLKCLATCHAISEVNGTLIGDPLDVKMFTYTNWVLEEPAHGNVSAIVRPADNNPIAESQFKLGIVKRFQFSSGLQRMSVIVKNYGNDRLEVFIKGSPEKLKEFFVPNSLPADYDSVLQTYTQDGYRVIACGSLQVPLDVSEEQLLQLQREAVEKNFTFCGFLIMSNQMKKDTPGAIEILTNANIRNIMITGDNALTAINVGKQCGILSADTPVFLSTVDKQQSQVNWVEVTEPQRVLKGFEMRNQLVCTGDAFDLIDEETFKTNIIPHAQIYARMTPGQKTKLIEYLLTLNKIVGMCGDGANDCGALKTANVGLSLSEAEASVAAPFTSKTPSIASVITLLREGRCALVTSFSLFKYMALYSMIQFGSVLILYHVGCVLGDLQFLWADMLLILPLAYGLGLTEAYAHLTAHKPVTKLISKSVLVSIIGQIVIQLIFLVAMYGILQLQSWFHPFVRPENFVKGPETTLTQETTTIFLYANYQYIFMAIAYSISYPFRNPLWTNRFLLWCLILQFAGCTFLLLYVDVPGISKVLQMVYIPWSWRFIILIVAAVNGIVNWVYERIFVVWLCS